MPELSDIVDLDDKDVLWRVMTSGLSAGEIRKIKKQIHLDSHSLPSIVKKLNSMAEDEYLTLFEDRITFPMAKWKRKWCRLSNNSFKKYGPFVDLLVPTAQFMTDLSDREPGKVTKGELGEYFLSPQKLMRDNVFERFGVEGQAIPFNPGNFKNLIASRGFYFEDGSINKFLLPQDDIHVGWRLVSAIRALDIPLVYSNPKRGFYIYIPSIGAGPSSQAKVHLKSGIPVSDDDYHNYSTWPRIRWDVSSEDSRKPHDPGAEVQDGIPLNYLNHQVVAALILRQYLSDSNDNNPFCPRRINPIPDVKVNMIPPPKDGNIGFDFYLTNNVVVSAVHKKGKNQGKRYFRNLNDGERELLWSVQLWHDGWCGCYRTDDKLDTLESTLKNYHKGFEDMGFIPPSR